MNQVAAGGQEVVVIQNQSLAPVISIEQAIQRAELMRTYVRSVMVKGRDYGVIPGTEKKTNDGEPSPANNVLLQPGAERLCTLFGLVEDYEDSGSIVDVANGFFHFSYKCILLRGATREVVDGKTVTLGQVVGVAIGSANSREKKYRRGGKPCPECGAIAIKRSKFPPQNDRDASPGWYCNAKSGGCGANFDANDEAIANSKQVDNAAESFDLINTIQKMAEKRAKISAVRAATNASDFFNDEDDHEDQHGSQPPPAKRGSQKKVDWMKLAVEAKDSRDLDAIIERWKEIPADQQVAVRAQMDASASRLRIRRTANKTWEPIPPPDAAKPAKAADTQFDQPAAAPTSEPAEYAEQDEYSAAEVETVLVAAGSTTAVYKRFGVKRAADLNQDQRRSIMAEFGAKTPAHA